MTTIRKWLYRRYLVYRINRKQMITYLLFLMSITPVYFIIGLITYKYKFLNLYLGSGIIILWVIISLYITFFRRRVYDNPIRDRENIERTSNRLYELYVSELEVLIDKKKFIRREYDKTKK